MVGTNTALIVKLGFVEDNPMNRAGQGNRPSERSGFRRPLPIQRGHAAFNTIRPLKITNIARRFP